MPHFYFHLQQGETRREDPCGVCLPDAEAAWYQAYRHGRDLLVGDRRDRREWAGHSFEVEEEGGGHVWTLPLVEIAEMVA